MNAYVLVPFRIEECDAWFVISNCTLILARSVHTSDRKLDRHKEPQKVEGDLQDWPFLGPEQPIRSRGKDEGIPCRDSERAHEKVLVC